MAVGHVSMVHKYKEALEKHDYLMTIFNNPNAKVVPQEKATELMESLASH
jgi:hypothetical protein